MGHLADAILLINLGREHNDTEAIAQALNKNDGPEGIAHDDFGGKILPQAQPDASVVAFGRQVREALPKHLEDCPFLRVDMLKDGDKPRRFLRWKRVPRGSS